MNCASISNRLHQLFISIFSGCLFLSFLEYEKMRAWLFYFLILFPNISFFFCTFALAVCVPIATCLTKVRKSPTRNHFWKRKIKPSEAIKNVYQKASDGASKLEREREKGSHKTEYVFHQSQAFLLLSLPSFRMVAPSHFSHFSAARFKNGCSYSMYMAQYVWKRATAASPHISPRMCKQQRNFFVEYICTFRDICIRYFGWNFSAEFSSLIPLLL